ncbi:hypothetical protein NHF50_09690 [Flavobacterium sp. NRK F10]|uniref:hypothetical protein n=1 Tax=Flavobacterium TaxID=237 RepID=UPI001475C34E|nr:MULTISPECIES: hypothetical protein [Flavobacterium]MCO6175313.1 hypothetical protein [Flavobacterium sp. NRK F10]
MKAGFLGYETVFFLNGNVRLFKSGVSCADKNLQMLFVAVLVDKKRVLIPF